ncbi:hypothetical protein [Pseudoroseomonas cervicalis]|uniref:hypothetical protein n=1 Tax=Teichococcus cervicalis TaxID=204525 RepID=UPI002782EC33|nr:hypothetical protein [Pseudoroseomonas cervicalis]MDQ1081458.1 hypothetical protein [Pseudoroseomonas cervicalis]
MANMLLQTLPGVATDTSLPVLRRDRVLADARDGVLWLNDMAYPWCYSGLPPADGAAVRDIAERGTDGSLVIGAGAPPTYAGGGLDFDLATGPGHYMRVPPRVAAALWSAGGSGFAATATIASGAVTALNLSSGGIGAVGGYTGTLPLLLSGGGGSGAAGTATVANGVVTGLTLSAGGTGYTSAPAVTLLGPQYYMVMMYVRLPPLAQWPTSGTLLPFLSWGKYNVAPDLVSIGMLQGAGGLLTLRRQTAINVQSGLNLQPVAGDYGAVVQIAFWRNAAGVGARLRSANGTVLASGAVGANNAADFSALAGRFGIDPGDWWTGSLPQNHGNWRAYRLMVEDLAVSRRDPGTVLDSDYTRTMARGVFS